MFFSWKDWYQSQIWYYDPIATSFFGVFWSTILTKSNNFFHQLVFCLSFNLQNHPHFFNKIPKILRLFMILKCWYIWVFLQITHIFHRIDIVFLQLKMYEIFSWKQRENYGIFRNIQINQHFMITDNRKIMSFGLKKWWSFCPKFTRQWNKPNLFCPLWDKTTHIFSTKSTLFCHRLWSLNIDIFWVFL